MAAVRCFYACQAVLGRGCQESEEFSADVALEAADDLASGAALGGAAGEVGAGALAASESGQGDGVQRPVGYDRHDAVGRDGGNSRNGHRAKTVLTDVGPVEIEVPRDRDASFEPKIVAKRQQRLSGVDELVISLSAKGLTAGEVQAPARRSPRSPTRSSRRWLSGRTGRSTRLDSHRWLRTSREETSCPDTRRTRC
jgi:hypothetical protein